MVTKPDDAESPKNKKSMPMTKSAYRQISINGTVIEGVSVNDSFQTFMELERQIQDDPNISAAFPGLKASLDLQKQKIAEEL